MRSRKEDPDLLIVNELDHYATEHNLSFYELAAYAYDNDLHEWLRMFRSKRYGRHIRLLCRREKYNIPYDQALHKYTAAKALYYKRHTTDYGTWKD